MAESDTLGNLLSVPLAEDTLGIFAAAKLPAQKRTWTELCQGKIGTLSPSGSDGHPRYYQKFVSTTLGTSFKPAFLSDSLEALRAAAVDGAIAAILPSRVARRVPGELVEVRPAGLEDEKLGIHRILLISQKNCDPVEISILTEVLKPLF